LAWTCLWHERSDGNKLVVLKCPKMFGELRLVARIGHFRRRPAGPQDFEPDAASLRYRDVSNVHFAPWRPVLANV